MRKAWDFSGYDDNAHIGVTRIRDGFIPGATTVPVTELGDPVIVPFPDAITLSNNATALKNGDKAIGHGQALPPKVKVERMKMWYQQCLNNVNGKHDDCENGSVWRRGRSGSDRHGLQVFRLMELVGKVMVEIHREDGAGPDTYKYAVLSYPIGDVELPKYSKNKMETALNYGFDSAALPPVYRDAIKVATDVGLSYLWIDSMCLLDPKAGAFEKDDYQRGLDNMDRIYQGASLTICAAEHKDANGQLSALNGGGSHRINAMKNQAVVSLAGNNWGIIRGLYMQLRGSRYMSRGWTYQELVLSHRCLIFVGGMVYFRCRNRLYSEDTFWESSDDDSPSVGILNTCYEVSFLPKDTENVDPLAWYTENLQNYSLRKLSHKSDTINAFKGILNRITHNLGTRSLAGMPQSILDMALIWYHRPDIAAALKRRQLRAHHMPSWSWAAWTGLALSAWAPEGKRVDRLQWIDNYAGHIEYWYTDPNDNTLRQVNTGGTLASHSPSPVFPSGMQGQFLQLRTHVSQDFFLKNGSMGYEIRTTQDHTVGIAYLDNGGKGGRSDGGDLDLTTRLTLAQLSRAPTGDSSFDYGYGEMLLKDGDDGSGIITDKPALSAKNHDLRWVLILAYSAPRTFRRAGVGHIREHKKGLISWSEQKEWIALY